MSQDWDVFNETPRPLSRPQLAERYRVDVLFARAFSTAEGAEVLRHLRAATIEQPAWVPGQDASHGFAREGQNSIVREIERRIARARSGPPQEGKPT
jgi:hypothetical protein